MVVEEDLDLAAFALGGGDYGNEGFQFVIGVVVIVAGGSVVGGILLNIPRGLVATVHADVGLASDKGSSQSFSVGEVFQLRHVAIGQAGAAFLKAFKDRLADPFRVAKFYHDRKAVKGGDEL